MRPTPIAQDQPNGVPVHSELSGKLASGGSPSETADLQNLLVGQLGLTMVSAFGGSTLLPHIVGVLPSRTGEEVAIANTRRVVASVQHAGAFRKRAIRKLVGNNVSPEKSVLTVFPGHKGSVATSLKLRGGPNPAVSGLIDLGPKAIQVGL